MNSPYHLNISYNRPYQRGVSHCSSDTYVVHGNELQECLDKFNEEITLKFNYNMHLIVDEVNNQFAVRDKILDEILQVIRPEFLQTIDAHVAELIGLKVALLNQCVHIEHWQKNAERIFESKWQALEDKVEKLNLSYTSLRYDVNLVDLNKVTKTVHDLNNFKSELQVAKKQMKKKLIGLFQKERDKVATYHKTIVLLESQNQVLFDRLAKLEDIIMHKQEVVDNLNKEVEKKKYTCVLGSVVSQDHDKIKTLEKQIANNRQEFLQIYRIAGASFMILFFFVLYQEYKIYHIARKIV